jgi:crotonobetainyl-CoA:carnitine CoA-transferase CaiB-like acyl-CoA transferase
MRMSQTLRGITVVEVGQYISAPATTQLLADLGARVIKVESPSGVQSGEEVGAFALGMYRAYNMDKEIVTLDLKSADGLTAFRQLVREADVLVHNLRPGAAERLGIGADALLAEQPSLVYASVSGFGVSDPEGTRKGLDIAAQAEGGIMSVTGEQAVSPQRVGFALVDVATSYLVAFGILARLAGRHVHGDVHHGPGGRVEASLLDVAIHLQSANWGEYSVTGKFPTRGGNGQVNAAPAADLLATRDGHVVVSAYTREHWSRLCHALERVDLERDPRFATNAARVANRAALLAELGRATATMASEVCAARLAAEGIVVGVVRDYASVLEELKADSRRHRRCEDTNGPYVLPRNPLLVKHESGNA